MTEKLLKVEYVMLFINMQKLITNTRHYDKNKDSTYLKY